MRDTLVFRIRSPLTEENFYFDQPSSSMSKAPNAVAPRLYVTGEDSPVILFDVAPNIDPETAVDYVLAYENGFAAGFKRGAIAGADDAVASVHRLLGIDRIVAAIADRSVTE